MKYMSWLGYAVIIALAGACGAKNETAGESSEASRNAVSFKSKSLSNVRANIQKDLGRIANNAKAMGIAANSCPAGLDQACLDALFMALNNSRLIKSIATFSQTRVGVLQNGVSYSVYNATAAQPAVNTGFTLTRSTFEQKQGQLAVPWSGGSGELFLSNAQPQAGIGLFVTLTNKTSLAGIAGGFAGADVTGWIEGAFYCYLDNTTGTPAGACVVVPITSGGW